MPVFTPSLWKQAMCCLTLMISLMLMTLKLTSFFLQHVVDILIKVPFRNIPFRCCFCQLDRMCLHMECMQKELVYLSFIPLQLFPRSRWERMSAVEVICVMHGSLARVGTMHLDAVLAAALQSSFKSDCVRMMTDLHLAHRQGAWQLPSRSCSKSLI